jgi:hypothetical protein
LKHRRAPGASVQVEDTRLVERLARRVVLLPIGFARLWVGRHDDARLRAVDPRFPRVAGLDETTALQLEGVLTHVPDVAVLVLGVPIEGPFHRAPCSETVSRTTVDVMPRITFVW